MKRLAIIMLGCAAAFSVYADDDCVAAVDAADSMNVNQKECDYSDKGLNGFLQKAFKKGDEGAVLQTGSTEKAAAAPVQTVSGQSLKLQKSSDSNFNFKVEVDQWANLPMARAQLLPKALERCGNGFAIVGEHYRSLAMGRIELTLSIQCD